MQNGGDVEKTALNCVYGLDLVAMRDFRILDILEVLIILPSLQGLRTWPILTFQS